VLQTCDGNGQWDSGVVCHLYCSAGACADPPSCIGLAESCGLPGSNENCCATPLVPQGSYNRSNDANYPATVSDFRLDRFETTVGRFRAFLNSYDAAPGSKPKTGDGAHPAISGSGWDAAWMLPATSGALKTAVKCNPTTQTWTDAVAGNENKPMNCLNWYEAFAFCAWDGGRLPTEAEWNYAAAGGDEQRQYPWSSPPSSIAIDSTYAVYNGAPIAPVGSTSAKGDGKWTQAGLAGGVWEWTLDWFAPPYSITPCNDCSLVSLANGTARIMRGGSWNGDASLLRTSFRSGFDPALHNEGVGVRCARTP
jgi:formylglycine-generating enzyme required for sulfatase activity